MRKLLIPLLALCLLAACAPKQQTEEKPPALTVIGVSQVGSESGFRVVNTESIRSTFTEEAGYRLLFEDAQQKQDNQIAAIRKFIQQQVDYILLMPLCVTGWDSVLQEARAADRPSWALEPRVPWIWRMFTGPCTSRKVSSSQAAACSPSHWKSEPTWAV